MEKLKVKNAIISAQGEESDNYKHFKEIVKQKEINVITVEAGDKITIDQKCYLEILFPTEDLISQNVLNNNSIVAKFYYKLNNIKQLKTENANSKKLENGQEFSLILTGDVEKIAEKRLVELYKNTNKLQSTVLKVAHHGSKTSSTQEFLNLVQPRIALIGVGEKNKFGHPNEKVLDRIKGLRFTSL